MYEIWSSFVVVSLALKDLKYFVLEQRMLTHIILWWHISNSCNMCHEFSNVFIIGKVCCAGHCNGLVDNVHNFACLWLDYYEVSRLILRRNLSTQCSALFKWAYFVLSLSQRFLDWFVSVTHYLILKNKLQKKVLAFLNSIYLFIYLSSIYLFIYTFFETGFSV